jgi:two-component system response regulator MprA
MSAGRVLILDDEAQIRRVLRTSLVASGFVVREARRGEEALEMLREEKPDLLIIDINLPGMSGFEVCHEIRDFSDAPIIMLSVRNNERDKVRALDSGADDYVVKPFELEELMARVRALLRRTQTDRATLLTFEDLTLDTSTRQAFRNERTIDLTAKEYDLLELFLRHPHQVLTRELIFDRVWGYDFGGESNVLDVYIRYLRQKLEEKGEARLIHTVRGVGYVLRKEN